VLQIADTFLPYFALWFLMYKSLAISPILTIGLAFLAAGFLVRIFIIQHDCGHGSFLGSRRANDTIGFIAGVLTFTPYHYWRHRHAIHHATAGNLDRRGVGDVWTMTLSEYKAADRWTRFRFRVFRNPFLLFFVGPFYMFLIWNRFAPLKAGWRWHRSILFTNLGIAAVMAGLIAMMGLRNYLLIQIPVVVIAMGWGVWLFYVQHQFDGVYWARQKDWDYEKVALEGSSYYELPKVFQWFSGNIGFHHVHHLSPRVPNYLLEKCHLANGKFRRVKALRFRESLRCMGYRVWDEDNGKLVGLGPFFW
jgi:omega-6 fatty acid desaturase (delta-12 desaturase)